MGLLTGAVLYRIGTNRSVYEMCSALLGCREQRHVFSHLFGVRFTLLGTVNYGCFNLMDELTFNSRAQGSVAERSKALV